ncbi:hypothetical protein EOS_31800 [Caballeronia mineralivorans PML1(12)]|uniref:Uncharacterized protein n=1 Tax=Caballeronia mineralivorans PML1(12) TaxID=908627 RepID=A0A0J1CPD6_9BURK|nr:hypothetical protein EOS_31800 [Caballeronia mineralivorans PML1(12)]
MVIGLHHVEDYKKIKVANALDGCSSSGPTAMRSVVWASPMVIWHLKPTEQGWMAVDFSSL